MRSVRTDVQAWGQAITLGDLLLRTAATRPEGDGVVFPDERLSYADLEGRSRTLARGLIGLGVEPGDRVGVLMANGPDTIATIFAIALAGGVVVPINTRYRAVELPFVVADAGVRVVVTSDRIDDYVDLLGLLAEALPGLADAPSPRDLALDVAPDLRAVAVLGRTPRAGTVAEGELLELAAGVDAAELEHRRSAVRLRDDALLLYTSGTTSLPRGCRLTHEAIVRNWTVVAQVLQLGAGDRLWAPCPLFHLGAIGPLIAAVGAGAAFVSDTYFEPGTALELIERERATHLYPAYPPITQGVIDHPNFAAADLSSARVMLNVGPADLLRSMQAALPQTVQLTLYGSTEGGGAITYSQLDDDLESRVTTTGLPLPGMEARVVDPETGEDLPVDAEGEILVRSPGLFDAYHNDPEKTAAAFAPGRWYRTGDRGALDAGGRLRFAGRLKDMLKVGGENVAAAEIEAVLSAHPAIKLVQVVGVPDARLEEVPAAFVELRAGEAATADELAAFCAERIARFKVPRHVRFVSEWPMSATKIQKAPLRERLVAELAAERDVAPAAGSH
ncbi:MAG TPA: AMP-binding protein [Baekduia sp.]|uniref:class I adenylate-forming enzyme family protein n=1 Tax=Baekduia sp. TaxID=2600305 RepID=UPI002D78988B|nr:AMP-binding protein [Baekduia sp.]HET6507016.1 AMP-binding protein [Baekduia sp.]